MYEVEWMSLQRNGWFSRFTFSKFISSTERLINLEEGAHYLYRHLKIKLWHRYHGFPLGQEDLKAQAERLSVVLGISWSWRSGGTYIWCINYNGTTFRVKMDMSGTDILVAPKATDEEVKEALNVIYVKVMMVRLAKHLRRFPQVW
jgi:hypothetical protein